jgi:hypothetical protein
MGTLLSRARAADPGGGVPNAPVGSEPWAQRWRLELQSLLDHVPDEPKRVELYLEQGKRLRVWTLLNRRDGSKFTSFDEFCQTDRPYGLGRPFAEILPWLEALHGKRGAQLETAPVDGRKRNGANQHTGPREESGSECPNPRGTSDRANKSLRAILRAPQPIQQLYRDGLIGQAVAAKLGPDHPTPEQAARIAEITEEVRATLRPANKADMPKAQRAVNARVRELLGAPGPDLVAQVMRLVARMNSAQRERLALQIAPELGLGDR